MDKNSRKKIYKKALEIINVVNHTDSVLCSMGINLEFDNNKTLIGRTMNVLFNNPKEIIYEALGLIFTKEKGCINDSNVQIEIYVVYPESNNLDFSCLDEEMLAMLDIAAEKEEFADKLWDCFVEENVEARSWLEKYTGREIFPR